MKLPQMTNLSLNGLKASLKRLTATRTVSMVTNFRIELHALGFMLWWISESMQHCDSTLMLEGHAQEVMTKRTCFMHTVYVAKRICIISRVTCTSSSKRGSAFHICLLRGSSQSTVTSVSFFFCKKHARLSRCQQISTNI